MENSKKNSICPFYKWGEQNKICCESCMPYATVCIEFRDEEQKRDHMVRFCEGSHKECILAQDLSSLQNDE